MKGGRVKQLIMDYRRFLPNDWVFNRQEFVRQAGDWVQIICLNMSRFRPEYVPRSCCDFLLMPGTATGTFFALELQGKRHPTQRWVSLSEHQTRLEEIFGEMTSQFRPQILEPLDEISLKENLDRGNAGYWPNHYALCVLTSARGEEAAALRSFANFQIAVRDKPYDWVDERKRELEKVLSLLSEPSQLRDHLSQIRREKLSQFKALAVKG